MTRFIEEEFFRFLIAGVVTTVLSYFIYLLFLVVVDYRYAFSISFAVGIVISFFTYSSFVFRKKYTWHKILKYPVIYLLQYIIGLFLITFVVESIGVNRQYAPLVNLILLTPLSFLLNRYFFKSKRSLNAKKY